MYCTERIKSVKIVYLFNGLLSGLSETLKACEFFSLDSY